ncbi:hypothetical protein FF38_13657 [Lucilia cuprina]|uniref:C2H2-type domain-containing protein n=1 Tax=Lucilia cuprina TaxID=7375 RepID=A0A0L0CNE0_LUCCU|nr:hypothetical protein FF38_09600 [Lucilia cuprina]KNC33863.1 hypothetical protein FF38_13657 [Lucilia cuprina]
MTENVQCPVCTLYLHAGMNLSDHLETHPKEQVIRALVQMTISSTGVGSNNTLASVLAGDNGKKKQTTELDEKPLPNNKDKEPLIGSGSNSCSAASTSNSASNCSLSNQSVGSSSQNSNNVLNFSATKIERHHENERDKTQTTSPTLPAKTVVKAETNSVALTKEMAPANEDMNQCFSKKSVNQMNSTPNSTVNTSHSYHPNAVELANSNNIHTSFNMFGGNPRYDPQQRSGINNQNNQLPTLPHMPPPPPPASSQSQHHSQHQEVSRGIIAASSNGTFHSIQTQQLPPPPPPPHHASSHIGNTSSSGHRQTHMFAAGQHQTTPSNSHHQQSLKVIYTPNLPPPPPLQLFTYQPQTHVQHHQKPPPAYGTAISQIRSQHNQNKHQVTGSLATQNQTLQPHSVVHQQHHLPQTLQHNLRIQVPPPTQPIPAKHSYSPKTNALSIQHHSTTSTRHNQLQQHQQQQSKADVTQQQQQEQQQTHANSETTQNSSNNIFNSNENSNKTIKGCSASTTQNPNVPSYPQVSISPSAASASIAAVAASTLGRHTNSPFAALLAAAAGAPSPSNASSVLRYAESPVAHYLERENGDFIVQETPKHIVECVETDNGEFSVIERIYQSPPSVLHIHDDDDDDDDEDDDDSNRDDRAGDEQKEYSESKSKQHDVNTTDKSKGESEDKPRTSKSSSKDDSKMSVDTSGSKRKSSHDVETPDDKEIVDFVSISSDSSDEEEFISQEEKDYKNTTEKNKNNHTSSTSIFSIQTASTLSSTSTSSSVSPSLTTDNGDDQQTNSMPNASLHSTSNSSSSSSAANTNQIPQNSGVNSNTNTSARKKSSKNTITVLSDVHLNLNEYLDLVGNIIASSKVAAQRKTFASIAPVPLVKIEKEEPMDEYITSATNETNFKTPPQHATSLKANKHETEDITDNPSSSNSKQTTNNHNVILTNELKHDEQDEKKPQVFENVTESNTSSSLMTINSSHVTSVIRMATTSQHQSQLQQQQLQNPSESNKNSTEAEDLSQPQRNVQTVASSKSLGHTPLARKGPKKLVIKPKSSKTEVLPPTNTNANKPNQIQLDVDQEMPTTSAKARQGYTKQTSLEEDALNATEVKVKNEPITSITYENQPQHSHYQPTSFSILEQHLNSKEPILEFKEEKPCITESNLPSTSIIKAMKIENNVNDDARVLYDFANSKKSQKETTSTFPSSTSLFSSKQTSLETSSLLDVQQQHQQQVTKELNNENDTSSSSSSTYSSQSAMDATMPSEEHNESSTTNASAATTGQTQQQPNQVYTDFHFNYLYNNGGSNVAAAASEQTDIKNAQQFTTFYQNSGNNNNTMLLEDSLSSKHYTDYQQQQQQQNHQVQHQLAGTSHHHQWFNNSNNYQTSEPNVTPVTSNHSISNINNALSVDGNSAALDGSEVSKYLDLDSCKREQNIDIIVGDRLTVPPPPPPSSSTSCSFNGTTENSMAGICSTAATLNIRTDEKMPAKGEISEQESNCDIDNSWSQPMYGDISARFFKTTFPGIFPQDNGWNHEEYFTVQDLSASATAQATNGTSNRLKSYEPTSSSSGNNNSNVMPMFTQNSNDNCNIDVMPSTSAKIRKRRKRSSQDGKTSNANGKRMLPTSTVTSQQMMMQHQNEIPGVEFSFQHQQLQQHPQLQPQHLQQPSTSTAFLAGPSNASTALTSGFMMQPQQQSQTQPQQHQTQQKQRTKVYECGHCNAKYSKLKDRNAHMVDAHNYIRQNRRLVCPTTGLATPLTNSDMQDVALPTTSAAGSMLVPPLQNAECMGDYKQGIVKIENENIQRDLTGVEPINANLSAKTEVMEDDKQNLALVPMNAANTDPNLEYDTKPPTNSLPLSLTTPTSKLTTLYRMLVSFNMTTLKQNQSLSEFDENLIKSSIFFCYICRQNFNSVKLYDAHLTEHPAECFTCGKKFQRWKNFSLHLKRHLGWKEFGCTVCDKKFVVRSALVEHMRMHSGLSPLKCKVCGKHFKRYSNLTQHRKRHSKQIVRRKEYVCYCGEVLPSKARFLWHKETHDSKPKCCPHCCDRFVHVNSLRRHIRLAHSDKFDYTEPMECPICKQIFAKASMKAHMATHSTETQYDCAICSKSFSTKWNLKIHSWVHANRTAKPFKCEHCPKAFVREVDFKNHMNSHKQIKPYTCEVCGCKFIRKYNYMRHRREHHGNKKYTCDLCKKSFHRHYYLIEHRRIHTGERPFQCTICGKSSTTKTNHNKHLKIHHSRDPFTVEV